MRSGPQTRDALFWDGRPPEKSHWNIFFLECIRTTAIGFDRQSMMQSEEEKITMPSIGWFCLMELCAGWLRTEACNWMPMGSQRDFWESALTSLPENRPNLKHSNSARSSVISAGLP